MAEKTEKKEKAKAKGGARKVFAAGVDDPKWEQKTGMESPPLVSGTTTNAIIAQRRLRGLLFLILILLVVGNVGILYAYIGAVNNRQVRYLPTVRTIGEMAAGREATEAETNAQSVMVLGLSDSFSSATVASRYERILPYLDPGLHAKMKDYYDTARQAMRGRPQTRYVVPMNSEVIGTTTVNIRTLVPYELFVIQRDARGDDFSVDQYSRRVAVMTWRRRDPTPENSLGLFLVRIDHIDRVDWLESGRDDIWATGE